MPIIVDGNARLHYTSPVPHSRAWGIRISKFPASQQLVGTVTLAFDQPCTSALPLPIVCCLLGVWASAAPYGTSPTCLNPVPSHIHTVKHTVAQYALLTRGKSPAQACAVPSVALCLANLEFWINKGRSLDWQLGDDTFGYSPSSPADCPCPADGGHPRPYRTRRVPARSNNVFGLHQEQRQPDRCTAEPLVVRSVRRSRSVYIR